jgi:electron transport complex protein RnfE
MCSVLAVTTSVTNALGMGLSVTAVLICSNLFISLLRNFIPKQVRIAGYIIVISGFVTAVELIIKAYLPALDKSLGLFIPLIVVNCIILARAEAFASKNKVIPSVIDGLASGIGYTLAVTAVAFVRELLGTGVLFAAADGTGGIQVLGDWYSPATIFIMPAGAFFTLGILCAVFNTARRAAEKRAEKKSIPKTEAEIPAETEAAV